MEQGSPSSMDELVMEAQADDTSTVSLSDVLSSRNCYLGELELWALCRECCLTLEYVNTHVELFQSMYISPNTVAFDTEGNVCFLDLDMDPDPMFVAPEVVGSSGNSYKTHLFSLGMTLLAATEYNTRSDEPNAELSDTFTELLACLTNENIDQRPDLYTVLDACDGALGGHQSQEICAKIIGIEHHEINYNKENTTTQSDSHGSDNKQFSPKSNPSHNFKDVNDNCVNKASQEVDPYHKGFESSSLEDDDGSLKKNYVADCQLAKPQRLTLSELLNNLDRYFNESEVWALCSECVFYLQRKKKHLPAYISPDTVVLYDSGKVRFKPVGEEKLLEMIYMAPELQQKGTVSEKTCLYGLGKTLQSAVGHKYSSNMEDAETLDILIQAFTQSNDEKRPTLETAFEMCQEYEKCNRINYLHVRQSLYTEATRQMMKTDVENNMIQETSKNITSGLQEKTTGSTSHPTDTSVSVMSSAFQPVKQNKTSKINDNLTNMPAAFSSPATHFKPIVIEHAVNSQSVAAGDSSDDKLHGKDTNVVTKLKEIKDNMLKHHKSHVDHSVRERRKENSDTASKETHSSLANKPSSALPDQPVLSQTSSIGEQIPSAEVLVTAIAQYLKTHLTKDILNESNTTSLALQSKSASVYNGASPPEQAYQSMGYYSQPALSSYTTLPTNSNTILTTAISAHPISYAAPGNLVYPTNRSLAPGKTPHAGINVSQHLPPNVVMSSTGIDSSRYPVQYAGPPSYNSAPPPYYQNPALGMIAPPALPYQVSPQSQQAPYLQHYHHTHDTLHPEVNKQLYAQYYHDMDYPRPAMSSHKHMSGSQYPNGSSWHGSLHRHPSQHHQNDAANKFPELELRDPHSSSPDSPSPSLSKDSGICLAQQNDRLASQRQSPLFHVLQIIRDYFTIDGIFDTGVEDVVMTEYILSLRSLKWETFCNAVTEKYCHLVWSKNLLHKLYLAISRISPQSQNKPSSVDVTVKAQLFHQKSISPQTDSFRPSPKEHNKSTSPSSNTTTQAGKSALPQEKEKSGKHLPPSLHYSPEEREVNHSAEVFTRLQNSSAIQSNPLSVKPSRDSQHLNQVPFNHYETIKTKTDSTSLSSNFNKEQSLHPNKLKGSGDQYEHPNYSQPYPDSFHSLQNPKKQQLHNIKSNYPSSTALMRDLAEVTKVPAHHPNTYRRPVQRQLRAPSAPVTFDSKTYNDDDVFTESDLHMSAEMRKLSAELFKDRTHKSQAFLPTMNPSRPRIVDGKEVMQRNSSYTPQGTDTRNKNDSPVVPQVELSKCLTSEVTQSHKQDLKPVNSQSNSVFTNRFTAEENGYKDSENTVKHFAHSTHPSMSLNKNDTYVNHNPTSKIDGPGIKMSYNRSLSAVYNRQPVETGVKVIDKDIVAANHHRTASMGSLEHMDLHSPLLEYVKRSHVVYHSSMIQLSLTPEMNTFINSIDEENKSSIELRMAGIRQEILVLRRERKKSQKFYRRLKEGQSVKVTKGDQHVSDQTLKELSDIAHKLSFLLMCQTHLQMLLAELNGLNTCFLYTLSACDGSLLFQPCKDNPYLQFRTIATPDSDPLTVLQAGSPRGLMSYLYKSSALSDGYIHQFLMCFRYILTADQLLTFILDKCHSSQSTKTRDVNLTHVERRSLDLLHYWLEGYYSIDFATDKKLVSKLVDFIKEQIELKVEGADNLFSLCSACKMGDHSELMLMTELEEDEEDGDDTFFLHLSSPMRWNSFRSLLKISKPSKGSYRLGKTKSEQRLNACTEVQRSSQKFSVIDCSAHVLAEQLTLLEQEFFRKCHPVHFLNSQCQGVGVALSMPGLRTPSMSRKSETISSPKKGLFIGDPVIQSRLVDMITHSHELAHWVSVEVLSCGSHKSQVNLLTKFLTIAQMCLNVRNFATALSILDGLENLVVKQLPVWKDVPAKYIGYMNDLNNTKIKLKSESTWLISEKDWHLQPTIPSALFVALQIQQLEIGSFTLANGMYKWDKMRTISEAVDQLRIFRDHEYGFQPQPDVQLSLKRCLSEFSDKDLHVVASTQENNFRRRSSSSSLSGTLKRMKEKLQSIKK
nr:kinase non-catalytic C-lobe domain-containing protein 1-like [Biomphalaria glabrata]